MGSRNKQQLPLLACSLGGGKLSLPICREGRSVSRDWARGVAQVVLPTPLVILTAEGHVQYPAFSANTQLLLQALQKQQLGFFGLFVSFDSGFAPTAACTGTFSPI